MLAAVHRRTARRASVQCVWCTFCRTSTSIRLFERSSVPAVRETQSCNRSQLRAPIVDRSGIERRGCAEAQRFGRIFGKGSLRCSLGPRSRAGGLAVAIGPDVCARYTWLWRPRDDALPPRSSTGHPTRGKF